MLFSRKFLLAHPRICRPIPLPATVEAAGFYPTRYCLRFENGLHRVVLDGMQYREATMA